MISTEAAFEWCRRVTQEASSTFYIGSRFFPSRMQNAVWAIYAFCRTTDNIVDDVMLPLDLSERLKMIDLLKGRLDSRRVLIQYIFDQADLNWSSFISAHSENHYSEEDEFIFVSFCDVLAHFNHLSKFPYLALIDGIEMDLVKNRYATYEELAVYCRCVAGGVGEMICNLCGIGDSEAICYAYMLGEAMQITNILRDVGEDLGRGRIYIPHDVCLEYKFDMNVLMLRAGNGEWSLSNEDKKMQDRFELFMKMYIGLNRTLYADALKGLKFLPYRVRKPVQVAALMYEQILVAIELNEYNVFTKRAFVGKRQKLGAVIQSTFLSL